MSLGKVPDGLFRRGISRGNAKVGAKPPGKFQPFGVEVDAHDYQSPCFSDLYTQQPEQPQADDDYCFAGFAFGSAEPLHGDAANGGKRGFRIINSRGQFDDQVHRN